MCMCSCYACLVGSTAHPSCSNTLSILMSCCAACPCCGAGGLGLTAIITAKAEPFRSWGAHLASFGAQAALVAESPYYKLLIGRVLGYKEDNIVHHIRVSGIALGPAARGGGDGCLTLHGWL
jgi:hypothetical protein